MGKISGNGKGFLFFVWAWIFAILLQSAPAFAYRPFATEDAGVAGKGVVQAEMSWDYSRWGNGDGEHAFLLVPIFGITDRIELSAEIPWLFHDPKGGDSVNGIGDVNFVGKFLLFEEKGNWPAFALKGAFKTNTGSETRGLGSGDLDYSLVAVASKTLGSFTLHTMFGYTFVGANGNENIRDIYLYGFAVDYALTDSFHLVSEVTGSRQPDITEPHDPVSCLIGSFYKISEKITVDGGVRFGLNDAAPDWNTTVGVTITF